ncbi:MAG: tRNA pseudouridine(13) synthase TruD, partial [Planctomycetota bacterium]
MRLKQRVGDFKVRELLREGYLCDRGPIRVYRVTKRKLTTPEAIGVLAAEAGVDREQIGVAGLKDRQGITVQHMSVVDGREVQLDVDGLRIDPIGFAELPLTSEDSLGNAFDINVRALQGHEVSALRSNLDAVREGGVPNYFDDQRFGNLRAGQGWVALDLARGKIQDGLRRLLCEPSPFDDDRHQRLKRGLDEQWGNWAECTEVARRLGLHRSVFEHLEDHPDDFAGAFRYVASRTRLIHLYAWQSHVWNRAVAGWVRSQVGLEDRVVLDSVEGPLVCPAAPLGAATRERDFPLPGAGFEGVDSTEDEALLADALAEEGMVPDQFRIEGVPGFQLKPEPRPLFVVPRHLRVRPSQPDSENRGLLMVRLRFELPRGSYATLVVKRLCATRVASEAESDPREGESGERGRFEGGERERGPREFGGGPRRDRGPAREREFHGDGGSGRDSGRGDFGRDDRAARGERFEGRGRQGDDERRGGGRFHSAGPGDRRPGGRERFDSRGGRGGGSYGSGRFGDRERGSGGGGRGFRSGGPGGRDGWQSGRGGDRQGAGRWQGGPGGGERDGREGGRERFGRDRGERGQRDHGDRDYGDRGRREGTTHGGGPRRDGPGWNRGGGPRESARGGFGGRERGPGGPGRDGRRGFDERERGAREGGPGGGERGGWQRGGPRQGWGGRPRNDRHEGGGHLHGSRR